MAEVQKPTPQEDAPKYSLPTFPAVKKQQDVTAHKPKSGGQTDDRTEPKNESINRQKNNRWTTANILTAIGIFVNIVLIYFTYQLWESAVSANESAKTSAEASKISADQAKEANRLTNEGILLAKESSKENQEINKQSNELSKQSVESQIKTLNESRKQFELETRARITHADFYMDTAALDKPYVISFKLHNAGKFPGKVIFRKIGLVYGPTKQGVEIKRVLDNSKDGWIVQYPNDIITPATNIEVLPTGKALNPLSFDLFRKGNFYIYFFAELRYISIGTNKEYIMKFAFRMKRYPAYNRLNFESIEDSDEEVKKGEQLRSGQ